MAAVTIRIGLGRRKAVEVAKEAAEIETLGEALAGASRAAQGQRIILGGLSEKALSATEGFQASFRVVLSLKMSNMKDPAILIPR